MNAHTLQVTQTVDRIVSGWRGAPPVSVVHATTDLPVPAPTDARGMFRKGEAWVVASTQPTSQVGETLAHEALGHHAMRITLGRSWSPFMHAMQDGMRDGDWRLQCFRDEVRSAYVDDAGDFNLSRVAESDEITAAIVESRFDSATGRMDIKRPWKKLALAAAGHFSREGLYADVPASFEQLEGTILFAEHRLRYGGAFFGLGYRIRHWYASANMSKPWNPNDRPMSLRESESLLKAENDRLREKEDSKASWGIIFYGLGGLILFIGGAVAMASGVIDFLRMLFR
jgi:hypothetical protein